MTTEKALENNDYLLKHWGFAMTEANGKYILTAVSPYIEHDIDYQAKEKMNFTKPIGKYVKTY